MKTIIDVETRSENDLKTSGPWVYSEHPSTEITCMAIKEGKGRTYIWINDYAKQICMDHFPGDLPMISFSEAIVLLNRAELIEAHNVFFEKSIYENVLFDWPEIPDHKWRCSAAKAASFNLPRGLDDACKALGLAKRKDKFGYFTMMKLCKPRKPTKHNPDKWHESPEDLLTLFNYCIQDVEAEYALSQALSDLSSRELAIWSIDQKINKRGLYVDLEGAKAAIKLIEEHEKKLLEEFVKITYNVESPKQVAKTLNWLEMRGISLNNLKKETVTKQLNKKQLPKDVRRVLEIRKSLAKSSTAKFRQMVSGASADSRMRDTTMYYGAGTGRWAGKRVQPHNMPRKMPDSYEEIITLTKEGDLETLELLHGDPMQALSGSVRAFICAAPGHDLICGDYASIEGRVLAWLAEEEYVIKNYFDKKDAYCILASQIYGIPYNKILAGYKKGVKKYDQMRFWGKTGELACGYQGGEKAVKQFAPDMDKAQRQTIVNVWRANRPKTVKFWQHMESYAKAAIHTGKIYTWNNIKWGLDKGFLLCKLPSGRYLSYYQPYLVMKEMPWGKKKEVITFMGVDTDTKRWCRQTTYGGKLTENIVQATARDFLAEALVRLEKNKYPVVLHVHDEAISEVIEGTGNVKQFTDLMAQVPEWATGCPIEVDGFRTKRYRK